MTLKFYQTTFITGRLYRLSGRLGLSLKIFKITKTDNL